MDPEVLEVLEELLQKLESDTVRQTGQCPRLRQRRQRDLEEGQTAAAISRGQALQRREEAARRSARYAWALRKVLGGR